MELEIRGLESTSSERDRRLNQWQGHRVELRRLLKQVDRTRREMAQARDRKRLGIDAAGGDLLDEDAPLDASHGELMRDRYSRYVYYMCT